MLFEAISTTTGALACAINFVLEVQSVGALLWLAVAKSLQGSNKHKMIQVCRMTQNLHECPVTSHQHLDMLSTQEEAELTGSVVPRKPAQP